MKKNSLRIIKGENIIELYDDFCNGVDSHIEGCLQDGIEPKKPYSGKNSRPRAPRREL